MPDLTQESKSSSEDMKDHEIPVPITGPVREAVLPDKSGASQSPEILAETVAPVV